MSLSITEIISARAPQYSAAPNLTALIELAKLQTSAGAFGDRYNLAVALRVMHTLAADELRGAVQGSSSGSGQAGALSSESVGSLSRSWSSGSGEQSGFDDLATTRYGRELIELMRTTVFTPRTSSMDEN